jgi:Co/Zn/Cd efflux system component
MSADCCDREHHNAEYEEHPRQIAYRRVLWAVLAINAVMFAVEVVAGLAAGSASLQADALDFLGDAGNYGISLLVVGMALRFRAIAALLKGASMGLFGLWVLGVTIWHRLSGTVPEAGTMGFVGAVALLANATTFGLLWAYRTGDSNMRSAWICTRNDILGNGAVLLAAVGVFGTGTGWPDYVVAAVMVTLALQGSAVVFRHALRDLRPSAVNTETWRSRGPRQADWHL